MIAIIMLLFTAWSALALVFSLPILVCFPFFTLMLALPAIVYGIANFKLLKASNEDAGGNDFYLTKLLGISGSHYSRTPEQKAQLEQKRAEGLAVRLLFYRLIGYTLIVMCAFTIDLWSFFLDIASYGHIVKVAATDVSFSLSFWMPEFWWGLFSWPDKLVVPEQLSLAMSLGFLGGEGLLKVWSWLYNKGLTYGVLLAEAAACAHDGASQEDDAHKGSPGSSETRGGEEAGAVELVTKAQDDTIAQLMPRMYDFEVV
jgi:hypothetical protein